MSFEIGSAAYITDATMRSGVFLETKGIDERMYFNLKKSDYSVAKLLTHRIRGNDADDGDKKYKPLTEIFKTGIIEEILTLKNDLFENSVFKDDKPTGQPRYTSKKVRPLVIMAPDTGVINAPSVGSVGGIPIRVVINSPGAPLLIELSDENLTYLRDVSELQITRGDAEPPKRRRVTVPESDRVEVPGQPGVSYSYVRQAFRATVLDDNGKLRNNYFKTKTDGFSAALEKASARTKLSDYFAMSSARSSREPDQQDTETGESGQQDTENSDADVR